MQAIDKQELQSPESLSRKSMTFWVFLFEKGEREDFSRVFGVALGVRGAERLSSK
jgi:hypothetical protein